jgi:hypothetical protein
MVSKLLPPWLSEGLQITHLLFEQTLTHVNDVGLYAGQTEPSPDEPTDVRACEGEK